MTDKSETPKILDEISKSNAAKPSGRSNRQQKNARRRFLIVIFLFIPVMAALFYTGYQLFQLQLRMADLGAENQQLAATVASQDQLLQELQNSLAEPEAVGVDDATLRQLQAGLETEIQALQQRLADLQAQQGTPSAQPSFEWKILEAEYQLRLASQKLQLEKDLTSAIALLEQADRNLQQSGSSSVFGVRQAISSELTALRNFRQVDRDGLYLRIDNLSQRVQEIDLLDSMRESFSNRRDRQSVPPSSEQSPGGFTDSMFAFLASVFVWRQWEETPEAMLEPGQEGFIKQNLSLMLEQAKLALLARDSRLYRDSLEDARAWLQRFAVTDSAAGQAILSELEALLAIEIDPALPGLNQSVDLIAQLTARN